MKRNHLIIALILNLLIAIGYFIENRNIGFSQLSSDLLNSVPVCYKLDDPSLFKHDLFLSDVDDVKYYTPFFIESLRFMAKCTGGDYMSGINIFSAILHLIYGMSWFLLFYKLFDRFAVALFLSVIVRGIVWLPGFEIWGISDIWTMMPRTMYAAFMPIPFLLLLYKQKSLFYLSALLIGFIFNFHAITGLGGIFIYVLVVALYMFHNREYIDWRAIALSTVFMIVGMIPFLSTYFLQTDSGVAYDVEVYKEAFFKRIPHFFVDPPAFAKKWLAFKTLFFALPLMGYLLYSEFSDHSHRTIARSLAFITIATVVIFSVSVYVENAVNDVFGLNIRMAFQIIRAQKLAILPGYVALGYLLKIAIDRSPTFAKTFTTQLPLLLLILLFSKESIFKKVPFFKDDIATSIFPDYRQMFMSAEEKRTPVDRMLTYINQNVPPDAVFYQKYIIRVGSKRSVVLDTKGASMLIEGNPQRLIQWYLENKRLDQLSPDEQLDFIKKNKHVTHIMTSDVQRGNVTLLHQEGKYSLYKIN